MLVWVEDERTQQKHFPSFPLHCQISRSHCFPVVTSRKPELSDPHTICRAEFLLWAASFPREDVLPMTSAKLLLLLLLEGEDH